MQLRTQFIITMVFFGILLLMVTVSAIITNQKVERISRQERKASNIAQGASELSYLANNYLIYRESRQLRRWHSRFGSFSAEVLGLRVDKQEQQILLAGIQANHRRLKAVVDSVSNASSNPSQNQDVVLSLDALQASWSRIAVQNQELISDASRLSELLREQREQITTTRTLLTYVMVVLFGVFLLSSYVLTYRRILQSIATLKAGTAVIGSGNLEYAIQEKKNDEIGDLSRAFNRMTSDLKTVTASKADLERAEKALRESRDKLESRVRVRTAELELRNEELTSFTFAASHDLQEPLRKILTFSSLITDRCSHSLGEKDRDYLKRMHKTATGMRDVLRSLLDYSRLTSKSESSFRRVDLNEIARAVVSDLELKIQETNASVEIGILPEIEADAGQMRKLLQNLLENALKFSREGEQTSVRIHSNDMPQNGECELYIEDNGIGFEEKYLDRIFKPFQRLHGKAEYGGVGMGLAICAKVVERHKGRITAKSTPGKGSTFIVTLPVSLTKS